MTFKYIGEAVVLLGIAYSIFRWIARNAGESDARSHVLLDVDLTRLGVPGERAHGGAEPGVSSTLDATPVPSLPPDPGMLDGAAAMFGISRAKIERMEPRERALLLSGYRAAREAQRRAPENDQTS